MNPLRPKIGLLALSLELYETLAPALRASREAWLRKTVLPALAPHADVLFDRCVVRRDTMEQAVEGFRARDADLIVVVHLAYSPSQLALPALQRAQIPILLWNTQELFQVDASFTLDAMIDNHGVHGTQDLANVLLRAGVPFHYVTSHLRDSDGLTELLDYAAAAAAVRRLRSARIGLMGYPFPGMGDFAVDTSHLAATLGCSWTALAVEDYIKRTHALPAGPVEKLAGQYREAYDVEPGVTQAELESAARSELALRAMVSDHQLQALTYQFLALGEDDRTPTLPFVAASRLMADGIGFGGEGDLVAAVATTFLNWLQPPASFTEMFTIDFGGQAIFMSHMGEANVAMARPGQKIRLVARPSPITRTRERQLALVVGLAPVPQATLMALTQGPAGRWRLLAASVAIEDFGPLAGLCVPHFKIKPAGGVRGFLTRYAMQGGPHHSALCFGDARNRLRFAAALLGADFCWL
jgi:L-arabinose isomerase